MYVYSCTVVCFALLHVCIDTVIQYVCTIHSFISDRVMYMATCYVLISYDIAMCICLVNWFVLL